ncbi:protein phosphatase 2C domain-containing protein [Spirillospora sp. NPDC048911]|uniref:PP2C family protein-serine/threonine phosphatase n=1 Tax=Spirillospora sp. NPDC048911 TaxID=3364527 RepID=UPI003717D4D7
MTEDQNTEGQNVAEAPKPACPNCGEAVFEGEAFCEACGHPLTEEATAAVQAGRVAREGVTAKVLPGGRPGTRPTRRTEPKAPRPACTECGAAAIDADGYCEHCGMRQPAERDHIEIELPNSVAAGASDRGRRYPRNEDALAVSVHPGGLAAVVCDGVGSSPNPDDASRAAAETGVAELLARVAAGAAPDQATCDAALKAAEAVAALADSPANAPSCTYVSALTHADPATGAAAVTVGWVGDSRAYWLGGGPDAASEQLTEDDSWAAFMVAEGALTEAEAEAHPNAHVITAWLGADADEVRPRVRTFSPGGPGAVLVCSDGLWNYAPKPHDLAAVLAGAACDPALDPLGAARTLVRFALEAGGRDNISVAVLPVAPGTAAPTPVTPNTEHAP